MSVNQLRDVYVSYVDSTSKAFFEKATGRKARLAEENNARFYSVVRARNNAQKQSREEETEGAL